MPLPTSPLLRRTFAVALFAFGASACSSAEPPVPPEYQSPEAVDETSEAITSSTVVSRAMEWVDAKLLYCQSPNHQHDYDSACPSTCNRTSNAQWDPYRSDCSGFVSWAWGLPAPGRITSQFAPYDKAVSHVIAPKDLAPGDALNSTPDEHIILFKKWVTPNKEAVFMEEPGCSVTPNYAHEFTSTVTFNSNGTVHLAYEGMTFWPIRFDSITEPAPTPAWAATFVKQSWPAATAAPVELTVGETKKGWIELKNVGTKTWQPGVVKLAPIPRDQASNLAAGSWLSKKRVSSVTAPVPPGSTGKFEWDLEPSEAGNFKPYFGLVAEGITWFADAGGPSDHLIRVNVHAVASPPSGTGGAAGEGGSAGAPAAGGHETAGAGGETSKGGEAGAPAGGGGGGGVVGSAAGAGGDASDGGAGGTADAAGAGGDAGSGDAVVEDPGADPGSAGGCDLGGGAPGSGVTWGLVAVAWAVARKRRARPT